MYGRRPCAKSEGRVFFLKQVFLRVGTSRNTGFGKRAFLRLPAGTQARHLCGTEFFLRPNHLFIVKPIHLKAILSTNGFPFALHTNLR